VPGDTLQRNSARSLPVFLEMDFHQALTNSLWLCSSGEIGVCNNPHKCWLYHGSPLLIQLVNRVLVVHFSRELLFYIPCSVSQTTQVLHFSSQKVLGMDGVTYLGGNPTALLPICPDEGIYCLGMSEKQDILMLVHVKRKDWRPQEHPKSRRRHSEEDIQSTTPYHSHGTRFNYSLLHSCARKDPVWKSQNSHGIKLSSSFMMQFQDHTTLMVSNFLLCLCVREYPSWRSCNCHGGNFSSSCVCKKDPSLKIRALVSAADVKLRIHDCLHSSNEIPQASKSFIIIIHPLTLICQASKKVHNHSY
jgi:hypothetical protein